MKAGSIDGTDTEPHDKAISRAMQAHYEPPHGLKSKPERTLFVARFGSKVAKHDLKEVQRQHYPFLFNRNITVYLLIHWQIQFFSRYGDVVSVKVIVDIVTGLSQGFGFVEMRNEDEARRAVRRCAEATLKGYQIFVDYECGRTLKGWKPRRLGKLLNSILHITFVLYVATAIAFVIF